MRQLILRCGECSYDVCYSCHDKYVDEKQRAETLRQNEDKNEDDLSFLTEFEQKYPEGEILCNNNHKLM